MGAFNNSKQFNAPPVLIDSITENLINQLQAEGYEITKQKLISGGYDISLTKGDIFKAIIGMKTALKVLIRPSQHGISVEASIGIFGHQAIPTIITMLIFWPVLIPQIWGLVEQSKLDDKVMDIIEQSIMLNPSSKSDNATRISGENKFCTNCGNQIISNSQVCVICGKSLTN